MNRKLEKILDAIDGWWVLAFILFWIVLFCVSGCIMLILFILGVDTTEAFGISWIICMLFVLILVMIGYSPH